MWQIIANAKSGQDIYIFYFNNLKGILTSNWSVYNISTNMKKVPNYKCKIINVVRCQFLFKSLTTRKYNIDKPKQNR